MRKILIVMLMSIMPLAANAEWVGGIGYYNISDEDDGAFGSIDVSLGVLAASIGYRFEQSDNFSVMPELRLGFGAGDDTVIGFKVEVDSLWALSVRAQYDFASGVYLFGAPSYTNLDLKASGFGVSASDDDGEFGIGAGVGYWFSERASGELSYETYDGTDVLGVSLRLGFQ